MDEIKFAKFPNEFNVTKHLELSNGTLLLFFWSERAIFFVVDYKKEIEGYNCSATMSKIMNKEGKLAILTFNIFGAVLKFILKFGNQKSSESL